MAAVCDGMGGRARGELASSTAVQELSEWFDDRLPLLFADGYDIVSLRAGIEFVIRRISSFIENYGQRHDVQIGTTLTMLILYDGHCVTANVGDSRAYAVGTTAFQMTKDHSVVQRDIDSGLLCPEAAETDKRRNILTQCLGETSSLSPDIVEQNVGLDVHFLLCSDGFRHKLPLQEMREVISECTDENGARLEKVLSVLAQRVMDRGETDNITAVCVRLT